MQESSADRAEIARFDRLAGQSWDPKGPMRPLHQMNALRVRWIGARLRQHFPRAGSVSLLDVGCGAGLASEALARQGFSVLGLDPSAGMIAAAEAHAQGSGLPLCYRVGLPGQLLEEGARFAAITALEVIEHVPEPARFLVTLASLLAPGGVIFLSTINRTLKSLLIAKLGAEYVLRLLPAGTHDWRRFISPAELEPLLGGAGLRLADIAGMTFDPLLRTWRESCDLSVNYIVMAGA